MSLVTFKGTLAAAIKEVPAGELYTTGWFWCEDLREYWRFEVDRDAPTKAPSRETIFKISMDGRVLSMFVGSGDFLKWDASVMRDSRSELDYGAVGGAGGFYGYDDLDEE